MFVLYNEGRFKECLASFTRINAQRKPLGRSAKAFMLYLAGKAENELGMTKKARRYLLAYLKDYIELKDEPVKDVEDQLDILMTTFMPDHATDATNLLLDILLADDTDESVLSQNIEWLWSQDSLRGFVQNRLLQLEQNDAEDDSSTYWKLVHAIITSDTKGHLPLDLMIIWDDHEGLRNDMPAYFNRLFLSTNPLMLDTRFWEIGLRRGAVLDERIKEIPLAKWKEYVIEFISNSNYPTIMKMAGILDEIYLGMPDEYYTFYRTQAAAIEQLKAENDNKLAEEKKRQQNEQAAKTEMAQIIAALEKNVDDLVGQGLLEEADMVLQEIQKYTSLIDGM